MLPMFDLIALFWCCLNPVERGITTALLFFWFGGTGYVEKITYDALWLATGAPSLLPRKGNYTWVFNLTPGVVDVPGVGPVDVLFFGASFWPFMYQFSLTDAFLCPEPCPFLVFV